MDAWDIEPSSILMNVVAIHLSLISSLVLYAATDLKQFIGRL